MVSLSDFRMLVGARYFFLFSSISIVCLAYPATCSVHTSVLLWGQIAGGVIKTTDLQQACRTVAKSFLVIMRKLVRFNWKLFLGNVMEPSTLLRWVFVYQHMALVFRLLACDCLYISLSPQWLLFSSSYPWC